VINVSPDTISNVDVQFNFQYSITPAIFDTQMKFGGSTGSGSPLFGYAGVGYFRSSEVNGTNTDLKILPFATGNAASACWPAAPTPYNWPYLQPSQPSGTGCNGGCTSQIHLAASLESNSYATVQTTLQVFKNSVEADAAVAAANPLFYCMGTYLSDPALFQSIPLQNRQVIAAFTGTPSIGSGQEPVTCPCVTGNCTDGQWGGSCRCDSQHWGDLCQFECNCHTGACDSVTGACTCSGPSCGPTCASTCNCEGYCNPATCQCLCVPGSHGVDCSRGFFCPGAGEATTETSTKSPSG